MARQKRVHYYGASYRVKLEGNNGQNLFVGDLDYARFYQQLKLIEKKYDFNLQSYYLQPSCITLEITVKEIPLAKIMQTLTSGYVRWFNQRYTRTGHLFQGRYQATLLETPS